MRLIGVVVILCAGMAGQGDAQKQDKRGETVSAAEMAWARRHRAIFNDLLDHWEKCIEQLNSGTDKPTWCNVYQEQYRYTPIEDLVRPSLAAKLKAKLTAEEIESLKIYIGNAAEVGYYYVKEKGAAK